MAQRRTVREYLVLVLDHDRKCFNIFGPVMDDRAITDAVWQLQQTGRRVNCSTGPADRSIELVAQEYAQQTGYTFTEEQIA